MPNYEEILKDFRAQFVALEQEHRIQEQARRQREDRMIAIKNAIKGIEAIINPNKVTETNTYTEFALSHSLKENVINVKSEKFNYPADDTWENRIKAVLKFKNVPLKISDMMDEFKPFEPDYDESRLKGALNNTIQTMFRAGKLKIYKPPRREKGFYYANPVWFEGDKLKDEHLPNLKQKQIW